MSKITIDKASPVFFPSNVRSFLSVVKGDGSLDCQKWIYNIVGQSYVVLTKDPEQNKVITVFNDTDDEPTMSEQFPLQFVNLQALKSEYVPTEVVKGYILVRLSVKDFIAAIDKKAIIDLTDKFNGVIDFVKTNPNCVLYIDNLDLMMKEVGATKYYLPELTLTPGAKVIVYTEQEKNIIGAKVPNYPK